MFLFLPSSKSSLCLLAIFAWKLHRHSLHSCTCVQDRLHSELLTFSSCTLIFWVMVSCVVLGFTQSPFSAIWTLREGKPARHCNTCELHNWAPKLHTKIQEVAHQHHDGLFLTWKLSSKTIFNDKNLNLASRGINRAYIRQSRNFKHTFLN